MHVIKKLLYPIYMLKMKDKELIELTLKCLKSGAIDEKYAVETILERYSNSKRFNWNNFQWGVSAGLFIMLILAKYFIKL